MADGKDDQQLRTFELRLLRCSLSPSGKNPSLPSPQPSDYSLTTTCPCQTLIQDLLQSVESGNYLQALSSIAIRTVFKLNSSNACFLDSTEFADRFYSDSVIKCVESFLIGDNDSEDYAQRSSRAILVMAIAVAALLAFSQCNITGPLERLPLLPVMPLVEGIEGDWGEWEVWARNELMAAGSDLLGKFSNLQYLVFAKILLMKLRDFLFEERVFSIGSVSWWVARVLVTQQKILEEHSSSLFDLLQVYMSESLHCFGSLDKVKNYWIDIKLEDEEARTVVSMLHLEVGIMEHTYGRVDSSELHFKSAEEASGLHLSVSGALGFRTEYQVDPKAQLLLVTDTNTTNNGDNVSAINENDMPQHGNEMREASDILITPRFLGDNGSCEGTAQGIQTGGTSRLNAIQQAVILAQCLSIEKSARHDEMQNWEMAPYIEAIGSQKLSCFIIRSFCDILRIRWESTRSRTKERALLMMDKLVQGIFDPSPGPAQRIFCFYGVHFPCIPSLRKEHGDLLIRCGLIGEAVKVYEDLELWDNVIYCYCLLEKKAIAVELIKTRLSERPNDPRLWCSLGDVTNDDSCYEKALEVSKNRSARAKRSLARSAYNRGDYESSKTLWESALASNSLYPDGWFALGAAALKARDVEKALDGFTRAVQLDPDNGEAWNNIACLHMVKKRNKEAFISFKEALKFKRNSWQLWENFSHVAADVGNFSQSLEAVQKVLELSNNKRIDADLLERIMLEIEGRYLSDRTRETENLVEMLGKILQQIARGGGGAETWGLFARWHKLKGDLTMCSEALLKQVRSYQGSDLWRDVDRFKKFACASLELCKVYIELASSSGGVRELYAAEMHLKNTIKQAVNFSGTEEYKDLQAFLDTIQSKIASLVPAV
ncbi:hypothetical protein LguiA_028109 [Lonicera macranthoides]